MPIFSDVPVLVTPVGGGASGPVDAATLGGLPPSVYQQKTAAYALRDEEIVAEMTVAATSYLHPAGVLSYLTASLLAYDASLVTPVQRSEATPGATNGTEIVGVKWITPPAGSIIWGITPQFAVHKEMQGWTPDSSYPLVLSNSPTFVPHRAPSVTEANQLFYDSRMEWQAAVVMPIIGFQIINLTGADAAPTYQTHRYNAWRGYRLKVWRKQP